MATPVIGRPFLSRPTAVLKPVVKGEGLPVPTPVVPLKPEFDPVGRLITPPGTATRWGGAPVLVELPGGIRLGVLAGVALAPDEAVDPVLPLELPVLPDDEPEEPEEPLEPAVVLGMACANETDGTANAHAIPNETSSRVVRVIAISPGPRDLSTSVTLQVYGHRRFGVNA